MGGTVSAGGVTWLGWAILPCCWPWAFPPCLCLQGHDTHSPGALGHRELFYLFWASKWLFSSLVALRWECLLRLLAVVLSSVVCENWN